MKPLQVALVHRNSPRLNGARMVGYWSYPVPEFEWHHFPVSKKFRLDRGTFVDFDLIVLEDGKLHGEVTGTGPPVAYVIGDSTLSDEHYRVRRELARQCDLLLVDWDCLSRFTDLGVPVRRFSYCVNQRLMRDYGMGKDIDVGSFQSATKERRELEAWLRERGTAHGYCFEAGVYPGQAYAMMMTRTKIIVNLNRNPATRSHRVFDAMACRACVLTSPLPDVSGEERRAGTHYLEYDLTDLDALGDCVDWLLGTGQWETFAGNGYMLVREQHTWQVRASELRQLVEDALH